jgi:hypothetical protein
MKKIGLVCLALVLALGTLGVGFAHWSQTLYIDTTVNTGSFCIGFTEANSDDPAEELCNPGAIDDADRIDPGYDKNVAGCWVELMDEKDCCVPEKTAYEKMEITVCNAYPSYENTINFSLDNCGTVPAELTGFTIVDINGTPVNILVAIDEVYDVDFDDDGEFDMNLKLSGTTVTQIDPCNSEWFDLWMHFKDGVDEEGESTGLQQDTTYTFDIEVETLQWNLAGE